VLPDCARRGSRWLPIAFALQAALLAAAAARPIAIPLGLDLYMPIPEDNPLTVDRIALGKRLFHDKRLSRDRTLACASCHDPARAFSGDRARSVGVFGRQGPRNVPALVNRGYGRAFFWDARIRTLEEQVIQPIVNPVELDLTMEEASARTGLSATAIARALASYVRSILSGDSRFDRYLFGDREALTADERRGLDVFRGKGNCVACHVGPNFTDELLHNTGVAYLAGQPEDRGGGSGNFKTPTLREVARTAPYMHDGSLATLEAVVDFYADGGRPNAGLDREIAPRHFTPAEKEALIAFLRSLSGTIVEGLRHAPARVGR
jgi:cytochrome c peroxidase